jgi:hypothetical protein
MITKIYQFLFACLVCCTFPAALTSCSDDHASDLRLSGDCMVEAIKLDNFE